MVEYNEPKNDIQVQGGQCEDICLKTKVNFEDLVHEP